MAKAQRQTTQPAFVPVVLTLESQDEVDAVYEALTPVKYISGDSPNAVRVKNNTMAAVRGELGQFVRF